MEFKVNMIPVTERLPRNGFYHVLQRGRHNKMNDNYAEFRDGKFICSCWKCNEELRPAVEFWGELITDSALVGKE